jgi:hypothetical protein
MRPATIERNRWILQFVREAIERSQVTGSAGQQLAMRLVDFESDQGKLEELHRAYSALKPKSPDEAEMLREQRLLAIALGSSKTDVRLIDPGFTDRYMPSVLPTGSGGPGPGVRIPGTSITAAGPSQKVEALRALTNEALRAKAVELSPGPATREELAEATASLAKLDTALEGALKQAGKQSRVIRRRFAAADRLSDANEDLLLSVAAVADARSTGTFDADDLDEVLLAMKVNIGKLAQIVARGPHTGEGVTWLRAAAAAGLPGPAS